MLVALILFWFLPNQVYDRFIGLTVLLKAYYFLTICNLTCSIYEFSQTLLTFSLTIC